MQNSEELTPIKRKLASVQVISNLQSMKKNQEELATVLGWKIFVPFHEFQVGEKIIYYEIDSLLPAHKKWTEHLKNKNLRVKTIEKYKEISQGLIMKLDTLLQVDNFNMDINELPIGFDLTEIMEIKKYEDDSEQLESGNVKLRDFPKDLIEKTDEIRLQSLLNYLKEFRGKKFYSSLKYDGCSATFLIDPISDQFYICSRNQVLSENSVNIYSKIALKYDIKKKLIDTNKKYAIQGEIYGPKILNNPLNAKELSLAVFNIKNIKENYYLGFDELVKTCKELDLPMVLVIEEGVFNYNNIDELVNKSKGFYPGTNVPREGLVYRVKDNWNDKKRLSFKVINNDYLIYKNKK